MSSLRRSEPELQLGDAVDLEVFDAKIYEAESGKDVGDCCGFAARRPIAAASPARTIRKAA